MNAHLYSGTGNLLWVIEDTKLSDANFLQYATVAQQLCDHNRADGVILMHPETHQLWVINQDGSDGGFCGNGLRVAAYHIQETRNVNATRLTMAGRHFEATMTGNEVSVYFEHPESEVKPCKIEGVEAYAVKVPNPHLVFLNPAEDWAIEKQGAEFCKALNTNVEFVYSKEDCFHVDVYERGVGITQACGSGAIAVFQTLQNLKIIESKSHIKMPGGDLTVTQTGDKLCLSGGVLFLESERIECI